MKLKNIQKKLISSVLAGMMLWNISPRYTYAENIAPIKNILYETESREIITSGVTYEMKRRFTEAGWLDIHAMLIDISNPYIKLGVLDSETEFGKKETLEEMMKEKGAIGGINGDFFNVSKNPTDPIGPVVKDGELNAISNRSNYGYSSFAAFFLDKDNSPFFDFCSVEMQFFNENGEELLLQGINRVTNFTNPVYIDQKAMKTTHELDKYNPGLYKIVVENNRIRYISTKSEPVTVPENGYVIAMNEKDGREKLPLFKVGQGVTFRMSTSVDMSNIELAIGGAGKIVSQGKVVSDQGYVVDKNKRHPRSAIGITKDKNQVIFLVVDGRSHSIGVTHEELGDILLEYGAYEAIHFDGGGSSTLIGRPRGEIDLEVYNQPSDGQQRKIANGLGVYSTAPQGTLKSLTIKTKEKRVFQNSGLAVEVIGYDEYYNSIEISPNDIVWEVNGLQGKWEENVFYPETIGEGTITARVGNISTTISVTSMNPPVALELSPKMIKLGLGQSIPLEIMGVDQEGYRVEYITKEIKWSIDPRLGTIQNGIFTAGQMVGEGMLTGTIGDVKVYGYVIVGHTQKTIDDFETAQPVKAVVYPEYVKADARYDSEQSYEGNKAIKLFYFFSENIDETQAAYIEFQKPYQIEGNPVGIGLWVNGDESNNWLRGKIKDNKGNSYNIDFAHQVDWKGWKYVEASIPPQAQGPITLERIYITAVRSSTNQLNYISIDHLVGLYTNEVSDKELPQDTKFTDHLKQFIPSTSEEDSFDITVFGSTAGKNRLLDYVVERETIKQMGKNAEFSIFAGNTEVDPYNIKTPYIKWNDKYEVEDYKNIRVIQLATSKNGLRLTNPEQWKLLQKDLETTTQDHIIIVMNKDAFDAQDFTDPMEGLLFHDILKTYKEKTNKNIFVIDASGYDFKTEVKEGIRYMHINGLWYKLDNKDLDIYNSFSILRFRVKGKEIAYDVQSVYPKVTIAKEEELKK